MHELPVIREVLDISFRFAEQNNAKKIVRVTLSVGEMRELVQEWMQRYFTFASRGTIAEDASLHVNVIRVVFRCAACGEHFTFDLQALQNLCCPECGGRDCAAVSGSEFLVDSIEII